MWTQWKIYQVTLHHHHKAKNVQINFFIYTNHGGDRVTRRSQTRIKLFGNIASLMCYSKSQNTVEFSTFGSDFVTLCIATELITSFCYKLRMFCIPLNGPANGFCDNEAIYSNSTFVESQLKRKHNSICYHLI